MYLTNISISALYTLPLVTYFTYEIACSRMFGTHMIIQKILFNEFSRAQFAKEL